jgi:hypothetical protein
MGCIDVDLRLDAPDSVLPAAPVRDLSRRHLPGDRPRDRAAEAGARQHGAGHGKPVLGSRRVGACAPWYWQSEEP